MSDFFSGDLRSNATEYSVSEISGALKRAVEDQFGNVRVRGEISGYRGPHSSGHAYFALKDDRARIEAVIWKGTFARLKYQPEEGMEVIASGKLTTYPGSSKYQIVIDSIEPAGAGALMALLEERRRRLAAEGLFDAERKQLLPFMPCVIGVVTSPTGAVIRDIIHRISDRFPLHVLVWSVRVQGETTGAEVAAAVAGFNALDPAGPIPRPDVLIVARGGGSLEDLWGFNDESVVRAVASSGIPVISAVGHETDWTLVDHAADVRAPTPTGAAELAVPVRADLEATLARFSARLRGCMSRNGERKRHALRGVARALPSSDQLLALPRRRFDEAASRLERALASNTSAATQRLRSVRLSPAILTRRVAEMRRRLERDGLRLPAQLEAVVARARLRLSRDGQRITPAALSRRVLANSQLVERFESRAARCFQASVERAKYRLERSHRLPAKFDSVLTQAQSRVDQRVMRLTPMTLSRRLSAHRVTLGSLEQRAERCYLASLERRRVRLDQAARLATSVSHQAILQRGFALVRDREGRALKLAAEVQPGSDLVLQFADGRLDARDTRVRPAKPRKSAIGSDNPAQESLF